MEDEEDVPHCRLASAHLGASRGERREEARVVGGWASECLIVLVGGEGGREGGRRGRTLPRR